MEELVSVIVPVYNRQNLIDRCVESLVNQTYKNIEIILVDDGSTDNSGTICDAWAKKDGRIKVLHKENGGVSSARNLGLDNAAGEYISFVDSDDSLDFTAYETCVEHMAGDSLDVLVFGARVVQAESTTTNKMDFTLYNDDDWAENGKNFLTSLVGLALWNKLYRSEIIQKNNLRFDTGVSMGEDGAFNISLFYHTTRIKCIPDIFYTYYIGSQNTISKGMVGFYKMLEEQKNQKIEFARYKGIEDQVIPALESGYEGSLFYTFMLMLLPNDKIGLKERKHDLGMMYSSGEDDKTLKEFLSKRPGLTAKMLYYMYKFRMSTAMVLAIGLYSKLKGES